MSSMPSAFKCSDVLLFCYSNVQLPAAFKCSIVLLFRCSIVLLFKCSIACGVQMFRCSIVLLFKCSIACGVQMFNCLRRSNVHVFNCSDVLLFCYSSVKRYKWHHFQILKFSNFQIIPSVPKYFKYVSISLSPLPERLITTTSVFLNLILGNKAKACADSSAGIIPSR